MGLQTYVNSVTGTGPPRCPDTQFCVLSEDRKMQLLVGQISKCWWWRKRKQRQKEDIWSDNQKSSWSYLMVWNSDNAVTFKNGEEREKKHFLKGRISVESFLWKGMETHWDIYISTEIFLTQHAAKEQFCIHGQGTHTAWSKPNRS